MNFYFNLQCQRQVKARYISIKLNRSIITQPQYLFQLIIIDDQDNDKDAINPRKLSPFIRRRHVFL